MFLLNSILRGAQISPFLTAQTTKSFLPITFYSKKPLEELAGIPQKPKRPLPTFTRYLKNHYPEFKANNPKLTTHEIMKLLAQSWKNADEETRKRHEEEFKQEKEVYQKEYEVYKNSLTSVQKDTLKTIQQERLHRREKLSLKKKEKLLGKPKGIASAFARFLSEEVKRDPRAVGVPVTKYIKIAGETWKSLSEAEKQPYVDAYRKDLIRYNSEYEKWESRMMKEGHTDVIKSKITLVPNK